MPSPLALLAETTDARGRARLLLAYGAERAAAGQHDPARLARLVAESEMLLNSRDYEPQDPAWDADDTWHALASTSYRPRRADLLERIHADWARPRFGPDAAVLLAIAETERDAAAEAEPDPPPEEDAADDGDRQRLMLSYAVRWTPSAVVLTALALVAIPGVAGDLKTTAAAALVVSLVVWVAATFIRDRRGWRP